MNFCEIRPWTLEYTIQKMFESVVYQPKGNLK